MKTLLLSLSLLVVSERKIIISVGQSLVIGIISGNSVAGAQVGNNVLPSSGFRDMVGLAWTVLSPASLTTPAISSNILSCNPWPSVCLANFVEPPSVGLANRYRNLTGNDVYIAIQGRDASMYVPWMQVGQAPFNYLNMQVSAYGSKSDPGYCSAMHIIHGESDHVNSTSSANYESYLVDWRNNVQNLCNTVTPQNGRTVVAFIDQTSSFTDTSMGSSTTSNIDVAQYSVAKNNPTTHKLIGAKYISPGGYSGPHGGGTSSLYWGNMAAKAIATYESTGYWDPVWPVNYSRSGANVVITYNVPVPPLVLGSDCNGDGVTVTAPSDGNFGFSYSTSTISSVALCTGTNTPITGCFAPTTCTGTNTPVQGCSRSGQTVAAVSYILSTPGSGIARYAHVGTAGSVPGQSTGVRGMLCDSDSTIANSVRQRNWGVQTGIASLDTVP